MSGAYDQGFTDGWFTEEQVRNMGFSSKKECLDYQEQMYQDEMRKAVSNQQKEYMQGWIAGARKSLL
jgi:hypothetical protein